MFQALFNSLSGLFSFSKSLNVVSNNVSNMNTPGFRGSDSFFENVFGGRGTNLAGSGMRSEQGDIRRTGTATDLAIDGTGFFILRDDSGAFHYTRAGQFRFNEEDILVDTVSGHRVMATDASGALSEISLADLRILQASSTTRITMSGNLVPTATSFTADDVRVYDARGNEVRLSLAFTNTSGTVPNSWSVQVTNSEGQAVGTGEIRFGLEGTPQAGFNRLLITLPDGADGQEIEVLFGEPGSFAGATQFQGAPSSIGARQVDGHPVLSVTSVSVDKDGVFQLQYSATEKRQGPRIALAHIRNESALTNDGGRLYSGISPADRTIGAPGDGVFGRIAGGSLELSNVDLTQEFADMIIIQRGYQASSRVMSVSNEMIENLYNSTRGG